MRLLVDAQLPPALARWLTAAGHRAEHVMDVGLAHAHDPIVWQHAAETQAVIVTKDEDSAVRAQLRPGGPPVVWIRYVVPAISGVQPKACLEEVVKRRRYRRVHL